jgi:hypothetical protein
MKIFKCRANSAKTVAKEVIQRPEVGRDGRRAWLLSEKSPNNHPVPQQQNTRILVVLEPFLARDFSKS